METMKYEEEKKELHPTELLQEDGLRTGNTTSAQRAREESLPVVKLTT